MSRWKCAVLLLAWSYCPLFAEDTEATLKEKVAQAVRMLATEGIVGSSGHVSARIPGTDLVLINSRDASREFVRAHDIVTVNLDGKKIVGKVIDRRQGDDLADVLGSHQAVLMRMHGAVVVGAYVEEAFCAAIQLEENAKMQITASTLGPVSRMTPAEVEDSVKESLTPNSIRKRWEYYRERDKTTKP
jgi:ribulose-5-phosphate 4-epimerase/fuculose-1-phosphate aldolase